MKSKLLKFTICQIFVLIGLVSCIADGQQKNVTASVQNVTLYDRSLQKVLSRRKRFLVWRPGSNVLVSLRIIFLFKMTICIIIN